MSYMSIRRWFNLSTCILRWVDRDGLDNSINSKWVFGIEGKIVNTVDVADPVEDEKPVTVG